MTAKIISLADRRAAKGVVISDTPSEEEQRIETFRLLDQISRNIGPQPRRFRVTRIDQPEARGPKQ